MFCPDWILSIACSEVARRFVALDLPLDGVSKYLSSELCKYYKDTKQEKLSHTAEEFLRFLAEIEEEDTNKVCLSFAYNQIHFLADRQPRKMRGLFSNAFDPQKEEVSSKEILKLFKVFVFNLRSYDDYAMPLGWDFKSNEDLEWLGPLLTKEISILDFL